MFPFFVRGYNRFWEEWLVNDVNLSFYIKEKLLKCKQETTEKKKKQNKVKKLHISDSCSLLIQLRNEEQSIKMHLDKLTLFIKIFAAPLKPFSHEKACVGHVTYIHRFVLWWLDMCVSFLFIFFKKPDYNTHNDWNKQAVVMKPREDAHKRHSVMRANRLWL